MRDLTALLVAVVAFSGFGWADTGYSNLFTLDLTDPPVAGEETPVAPPEAEVGSSTGAATDSRGNRVVVWSQTGGKLAALEGSLAVQQGEGVFGRLFGPDDDPLGDPFQVAAATQAPLLNPTVAFDASGGFVVGWEESGGGLYTRLFDATSSPVTPVVPVSAPGVLVPDTPRVATASAGDFALVWRAAPAKTFQGGAGIFGRFFDPDGTPKGDPVQVDGGYASAVMTPGVGSDAGGRIVVVWRQEVMGKQGGDGIFGRLFGPGGDPEGPEVAILEGETGLVGAPSVAVDTLGNAVVVWAQDRGTGTGADVYGQRLDRHGERVGGVFQVNDDPAGDQLAPSVAMSPVGDFAVAWETHGVGISGRFFSADGAPLGADFEVAVVEGGLTPVEPEVSVAGDNAVTVAYTRVDAAGTARGVYFRTFAVVKPEGACVPDGATNCINNDRFQVRVSWRDFQGRTGVGDAVPLTDDTGYFWFFDAANVELMLKVLDGRWLNGHYWVFFGALSNVEYTIVVTDTVTGSSVTYYNPLGNFGSVGDTEAIPGEGKVAQDPTHRHVTVPTGDFDLSIAELYGELVAGLAQRGRPKLTQSCTPSATTLCLNGNRFAASVGWEDFQGRTGVGTALPLTGDTGYFWFFDSANVELVVKALDGRWLNGHYWVFYGSLSNVEYTLTVTDTVTGQVKTYVNPSGNFGSVGDTEAFAAP